MRTLILQLQSDSGIYMEERSEFSEFAFSDRIAPASCKRLMLPQTCTDHNVGMKCKKNDIYGMN